ncbi:hypothetical protein ECZC10_46320 [Escherichia coli]|nr:hypothetical protein ECZC10_46320 [Escherichia coli]
MKRDGAGIPLDYDNAMAKYESQKEQVNANEAQITCKNDCRDSKGKSWVY